MIIQKSLYICKMKIIKNVWLFNIIKLYDNFCCIILYYVKIASVEGREFVC